MAQSISTNSTFSQKLYIIIESSAIKLWMEIYCMKKQHLHLIYEPKYNIALLQYKSIALCWTDPAQHDKER